MGAIERCANYACLWPRTGEEQGTTETPGFVCGGGLWVSPTAFMTLIMLSVKKVQVAKVNRGQAEQDKGLGYHFIM